MMPSFSLWKVQFSSRRSTQPPNQSTVETHLHGVNARAFIKSKLRVVEVRKDKLIELPDGAIPLRLDEIVQSTGLLNPSPSSEKSMPWYLEKDRTNSLRAKITDQSSQ